MVFEVGVRIVGKETKLQIVTLHFNQIYIVNCHAYFIEKGVLSLIVTLSYDLLNKMTGLPKTNKFKLK